jgi:hypothetical protein
MPMKLFAGLAMIVRLCFSDGIPRRSLGVALIVGSILNLINQGDALLGLHPFNPIKAGLTYLVPFCVATYGAVSYRLATRRLQKAAAPPDAHASATSSPETRG